MGHRLATLSNEVNNEVLCCSPRSAGCCGRRGSASHRSSVPRSGRPLQRLLCLRSRPSSPLRCSLLCSSKLSLRSPADHRSECCRPRPSGCRPSGSSATYGFGDNNGYGAPSAPVIASYAQAVPAPVIAEAVPAPVIAKAAPIAASHSSQYQAQDEDKNFSFGYSNINSAKQETGNAYGGVTGSYTYTDEAGVHTVNYVADHLGQPSCRPHPPRCCPRPRCRASHGYSRRCWGQGCILQGLQRCQVRSREEIRPEHPSPDLRWSSCPQLRWLRWLPALLCSPGLQRILSPQLCRCLCCCSRCRCSPELRSLPHRCPRGLCRSPRP